MLANMLLNVLFVGGLFALRQGEASTNGDLLARIASIPGLHMGIALASSVASYLNLWLLWRGVRRDGVYQREPGWGRHLVRLGSACAALVLVVVAGVLLWPDWSELRVLVRVMRLVALIGAAGLAYVAVLFATGFRLRDLHAR